MTLNGAMASSHVNPEDAVKIMLDLEADYAFGSALGNICAY